VRSVGASVDPPFFDDLTSLVEIGEQVLVETLVARAVVDGGRRPRSLGAGDILAMDKPANRSNSPMEVATIGLDISKHVFQSMQLTAKAKWPVANASGEARSCRSSPRSHLA
jgi:hypothetical protein